MNRGWRGRGGRKPRGGQRGHGFRGGGPSNRGGRGTRGGGSFGRGAGPSGPDDGGHRGEHDHRSPPPHRVGPDDFQSGVSKDQAAPERGFSQPSRERDVPDYQWPPPDYQWPPADDAGPPAEGPPRGQPGPDDRGEEGRKKLPRDQRPMDMFESGLTDRYPTPPPGQDHSRGSRRSLSPRRDQPPIDEGRGRPDHHSQKVGHYVDSSLNDTESLRITVGNEHFFGGREPVDPKPSALDRLGPRAERPQDYGQHQPQSSMEGEQQQQRYRERMTEQDGERVHRSRSSSLEKPRFIPLPPASKESKGYEEATPAGNARRESGKSKVVDYEHRGSRYDRATDEGRNNHEKGQPRSHQEEQRKGKDRGRERGRDGDRNWRDEESPRQRDPRRDKDFLAERSKKPSSLPPSDVSPLYHFLGKNEPKKQGSETDESKRRKPSIPMPTKSRHATSTSSSAKGRSKVIESAPDVTEPPRALKSILKKSILKKSKSARGESKVMQEAPAEQSPQSAHSQSPPPAHPQSPVTVQMQLSQSPQREVLPEPPRSAPSLLLPQPELLPTTSQPEQIHMVHQPELLPIRSQPQQAAMLQAHMVQASFVQTPMIQVPQVQAPSAPVPTHEIPQGLLEALTSKGPPVDLSAENINTLLSSLTGLYQETAPAAQFARQNDDYQQQVQQQQQPIPQVAQQSVVFDVPQPQLQLPHQSFPASSQQAHPEIFQRANPAVSQQMFPMMPHQAQPAPLQPPPAVSSQQVFSLINQLTQSVACRPTHPIMVSHQVHPAVPQPTFPVVAQQPKPTALALDETTANKIRDLAQSLSQTIKTTTSQPSTSSMFPSGEPEAGSNYLPPMHSQPEFQKDLVAQSIQVQSQMQNATYSTSQDQGIFGRVPSNQPQAFTVQSVEKAAEPSKPLYTGFVSLDDEDRFLYGDVDEEEKHKEPERKLSREIQPSKPKAAPASEKKVEAPSDDQIKNILSAIGFDFGLAQKIKQQKEQGKGTKAAKKPEALPPNIVSEVHSEKKISEPVQASPLPVIEDNLRGLNKTASFLESGLKMKHDQELDAFIGDAKRNVSKHKKQYSESEDTEPESSGTLGRSEEQDVDGRRSGNSQATISTYISNQRSSTEDKYMTEQAEAPLEGDNHQYYPPKATDQQPQDMRYQGSSTYSNDAYPNSNVQPQEGYYQGAPAQASSSLPSQQYTPIEQTVQFVSSQDSFPMAGPSVSREHQGFQPENIFISVNTTGDSSSSNRVVLLPKADPVMDERQRRILEIERRYQQGNDPKEVKQIVDLEREKERRLRLEAEELIEKEKQRRREERKRKEEEERKQKEEERKKKDEERRKKDEERKRRDEERKKKDEEEKKRRDAKKEKDREFERLLEGDPTLKVDVDTYRNKIDELETELEKLGKKLAELKRQTYLTSGHKESLVNENNLMQDKICNHLRILRRRMNQQREQAESKQEGGGQVRSRSRSPERKPSRDNLRSSRPERLSKDSKDSKDTKEQKESSKDSLKKESGKTAKDKKSANQQGAKPKPVQAEAPPVEKSDKLLRFEFNYYDPGDHWCKPCNIQSATLNDHFIHLHSKMHAKHCDPYDRPWMQNTIGKMKKKAANTIDAPITGAEFMMPVNGFFCRLCQEFFGDGVCAAEHLKTSNHNRTYEKFLEENAFYEKRLKIEKAAGRAQKLKLAVNQEREQKRKQDDDGSEESEPEGQTKKAKMEEQDIKPPAETKGQKGFGMFEFSKNEVKSEKEVKMQTESKPEKPDKPDKLPADTHQPQVVVPPPPPPPDTTTSTLSVAEKKAALTAKLAPMVGKMRGKSNKFLLRKTPTAKLLPTSKLVPQGPFAEPQKQSLTFDTLPVVTDKADAAKDSLQALKVSPADIADAFKGKSKEENQQPAAVKAAPKQSVPVSKTGPDATLKDKIKSNVPEVKAEAKVVEPDIPVTPAAEETDLFGPALPPPKAVSLEDMDEEDVCVPGMDDEMMPDSLPKPKPPPPVSTDSQVPAQASASACASSTATNLYNIFYKPTN